MQHEKQAKKETKLKQEFNLLDEPWIRVLDQKMTVQELTPTELLADAHEIAGLAGETEAQDVAVLRFLEAVLYSAYMRIDMNGSPSPVNDTDEALERWSSIWEQGRFNILPIKTYIEQYRDRFWLFDDTHPFYQNPCDKMGTRNKASKLNGAISESNNKARLFSERSGLDKERLTYAEAARWLLFLNGFDDSAGKAFTKGRKMPSPGVGWLGKLGLVSITGHNLFETLMLNLTMLRDGMEEWEPLDKECAFWEIPEPRMDERTEIPVPGNLASLYTLQSRHIRLIRDGGYVTGYYLLGGDFFQTENAFAEQMTIWNKSEKKGKTSYYPKKHDKSVQAWKEFPEIALSKQEGHVPGVISWVRRLQDIGIIPDDYQIGIRFYCTYYDSKNCSITDSYSDNMSFWIGLLFETDAEWHTVISNEAVLCEKTAYTVKRLAENVHKAAGMRPSKNDRDPYSAEYAREQFYSEADSLFREWLGSLKAGTDKTEAVEQLRKNIISIAYRTGYSIVNGSGPAAFIGRDVTEKGKDGTKTRHYSTPEATNWFTRSIREIYGGDVN